MNDKLKKILVFIIIFSSMLINLQVLVKAEENNNVLILNSYSSTLQWTNDIQSGIDSKLRLKDNISLYYEFMDSKYNNSDEYVQILYELYKTKYKGVKFDAIICSDNDALNFIVNYGEEVFAKCPVVFCGINDFNENMLSSFVFNYNELKKHKITLNNLDKLDSDYKIINKPFSLYETYKKEINTIIGIMIFLVVCIVILVLNIKRRVLSEQRYNFLAFYDQLTGLPNKHMFLERLDAELVKEEVGALFFIDIDNFKSINDTLGHDYGDKFLKHIAKEKGKNRYLFYDIGMTKDIMRKSELIDGLRSAIVKSEFNLLYQPQVNLFDGKVKGAEVLIRWTSSNLGSISPVEFIPLAEQTESIIPIGKWVLKKACLKNKEWIEKGLNNITVAVNVSVMQLHNDDFLRTIKEVLEEVELQPEYLEIEITESVFMNHMEENLKILNEIKKLGIKIALDDFGTGYSSLSYLRLLPINKLKIDKSFIDNICIQKKDKAIVEGIIKLAHKMDITITAEGVETKEQFDILKDMGCDNIQGYYFSKPISENEFEKWLR